MGSNKTKKNRSTIQFLFGTIKKRKIANYLIIAFAFLTFALAIIGSFDAIASKYAIGIGSGLSLFFTIGFSIWRVLMIHLGKEWNKSEIIWQSVMGAILVLSIIFWIWATATTSVQYSALKEYFQLLKQKDQRASFIVLTQATTDQFGTALKGGLWAWVVTSCVYIFTNTFHNMFMKEKSPK
ncbi:hypothetical protein [Ureaplasma urealyticum]|uniref:DUF4199 domain-containing protein n=1 Tax=Ureaplasma urealyticum TaxID=2130 RepID=A0ABD4SLC9_UREUR|nr:hypothetical protein [Ureaplasma urealyticum]MCF1348944.1 hypothetical protein [Ureaplasma urealyticum]